MQMFIRKTGNKPLHQSFKFRKLENLDTQQFVSKAV